MVVSCRANWDQLTYPAPTARALVTLGECDLRGLSPSVTLGARSKGLGLELRYSLMSEFSACHLATFHDRSGEVIVLSDSEDSVVVIDSDSEAVFKTDLPKAEDNDDDVRIPLK